jgi:hypothetical protein
MKKFVIFVLIFGFVFFSENIFANETFEGDNWNDSPNGFTKNIDKTDEKSNEKSEDVKNPPEKKVCQI